MIKFYWYPKCSTCKKAKIWLDEHHVNYQIINMIETPPSQEQFKNWMLENDYPIRRFFNTSGIIYRNENLKEIVNSLSVDEASERLSKEGMLIKRPILENGKKVFLGFKENEYETLL